MTTQEAYEKYKHLDHLLSDRGWLHDGPQGQIMCDLWQTIKEAQDKPRQVLEEALEVMGAEIVDVTNCVEITKDNHKQTLQNIDAAIEGLRNGGGL